MLMHRAVTLKPSSNPDAPPAASTATRSGSSSLEPVNAHVRCRNCDINFTKIVLMVSNDYCLKGLNMDRIFQFTEQ